MLSFLFRVKRKLRNIFSDIVKSFIIYELKVLHPKRLFINTKIKYGKSFLIKFDDSSSTIIVGSGVQFRDYCHVRSGMHSKLIIGDRVFFNNSCSINCLNDITIGNDCQFGESVKFYDVNHKYAAHNRLISDQGYNKGKIKIGSNCWFGSNVTVLKNVTIGDNVIIGANCLIYASIPSNSIVTISQTLLIKNRN